MVNDKHELTVDDLIVEYMAYKVKNGYEPSFTGKEFIDFLKFFETKMEVVDSLYEPKELFDRFFERNIENHWFHIVNFTPYETIPDPHMNMEYDEETKDYNIKANNKLSNYDLSVITTFFMKDKPNKVKEIRKLIQEYVADQPKRKIDESVELSETEIMIGKELASDVIYDIWQSHTKKLVGYHSWPAQCTDINKYLIETDLAPIIGLDSIRDELIELYSVLSKRFAVLYHHDKDLNVSLCESAFLAHSNYKYIINGYESLMDIAYGPYKKILDIRISEFNQDENEIDYQKETGKQKILEMTNK